MKSHTLQTPKYKDRQTKKAIYTQTISLFADQIFALKRRASRRKIRIGQLYREILDEYFHLKRPCQDSTNKIENSNS